MVERMKALFGWAQLCDTLYGKMNKTKRAFNAVFDVLSNLFVSNPAICEAIKSRFENLRVRSTQWNNR